MRFLPHLTLLLLALSAPLCGHAEVFKCLKDGKTLIQDTPCTVGSTTSRAIVTGIAAQVPWTGLKYGMSQEDIRHKVSNTKAGTGDRVVSGATELLRLENVAVSGLSFSAGFFFLADQFTQVNLSGPMMANNSENLSNFNKLVADFRSTYGQETRNTISNDRIGLSADADWITAQGKVWIGIVPTTGYTSMLIMGFAPHNPAKR